MGEEERLFSVRPVLVISRCLGFEACRWNGETIRNEFIELLTRHVECITVCPEVEIGLGVPRNPIRVELEKGERRLVQPATGRDITGEMLSFCDSFLGSLREVDGFLLKSRSPSCGIADAKIFPYGKNDAAAMDKGPGFFGGEVLRKFPLLPAETEDKLEKIRLREHFLVRVFTHARFRTAAKKGTRGALIDFHTRHKFLLMSYNQSELKALGKLVADPGRKKAEELFAAYRGHLLKALTKPPRYTSNINVLLHSLGYFSDKLTAAEKARFLDALRRYREKRIPLSVPVGIINSWIRRFDEKYLAGQAYFHPYPEELAPISGSGMEGDL